MEELQRRDQKGLYSGAFQGEIKNVVGVDIPFLKPNADIVLHNDTPSDLEQKVQSVLQLIKERGKQQCKIFSSFKKGKRCKGYNLFLKHRIS